MTASPLAKPLALVACFPFLCHLLSNVGNLLSLPYPTLQTHFFPPSLSLSLSPSPFLPLPLPLPLRVLLLSPCKSTTQTGSFHLCPSYVTEQRVRSCSSPATGLVTEHKQPLMKQTLHTKEVECGVCWASLARSLA